MNSGIEFVAVDMPQANRLTIHILSAVAEHEREMISQRTKDAPAAAKRRGVKLGNPRPMEALQKARGVHVSRRPVPEMLNFMQSLKQQGMSYRGVAREFNRLNIITGWGKPWYA